MDIIAILSVTSIVSYALCTSAPLAHAYERTNKMRLDADAYQIAQQLYRGWDRLALFDVCALLSVVIFAILASSLLAWLALACHIATFIIFFALTLPTNKRTKDWTVLPPSWNRLREQWEYSHMACALLMMIGLTCLAIAVVHI